MVIDFVINGHRYTNDQGIANSAGIPPQYQFIGYNAVLALESYAEDVVAVGGGSTAAAAASAAMAQAFAASAVAAPGTSATSTTSLTTGYGPCSLAVQPGKVFNLGTWATLASAAAPDAAQMSGPITSYDPATGAFAANIKALSSVGLTAADWIVSLSAPGGAGLGANQYTGPQFYKSGLFEASVDLGAGSNIDLSAGGDFRKTSTAALTLTVSGIPAGAAGAFTLRLTNGGAFAFTPPAGTVYPFGVVPALSVAGTDRLAFIKEDGGAWEMYVIGLGLQ